MEKESGKALILMINKNRLKIIKIFLNKNYLENYKIKEIKGDAHKDQGDETSVTYTD